MGNFITKIKRLDTRALLKMVYSTVTEWNMSSIR